MGVSKQQLLNSVQQVKEYVDAEVAGVETGTEVTYTDAEITEAVAAILVPSEK